MTGAISFFVAYFNSSKKIREDVKKITQEIAEESLKNRAGEIKREVERYVDESLAEERERRKEAEKDIRLLCCDLLLHIGLDSVESLSICSGHQEATLNEVHALYEKYGGANGFDPRLRKLDAMPNSLREVLNH